MDNVCIFGHAYLTDDVRICGNAQMFSYASASGRAFISGDARVYGNARIAGHVRVIDHAQASQTPVSICGLAYPVTIFDNCVQVGCNQYSYFMWGGVSESELNKMDSGMLEFHPVLMGILDSIFDKSND